MSTYEASYCNINTDLVGIEPSIEGYDRKTPIMNWTQHSGSVYKSYNSGYVSILFINGEDIGSPQTSLGDVDTGNEWYYDDAADVVYVHNASADTLNMMRGEDWKTLKERVVAEQSERVRAFVDRPIYKRGGTGQQSASSRNYDWTIIYSTASLSVSELIRGSDPEKADSIERRILSAEILEETGRPGVLVDVKTGHYKLWNEIGGSDQEGQPRAVALDSSTTGGIIHTRGNPTVDWDVIKISIGTGGTFAQGSASSVTYSTYVGDTTGLKITQHVNAETIDGSYQTLAHGVLGRFQPGVYVANDEWELEVSGMAQDTGIVKSVLMARR